MVSGIFGGKNKAQLPKQPVPPSDAGSSLETNYSHYTHGSNVNAHLRPMTYDSMATNSLIAQPGSGLNSSLSHSPPQKMLHGYGSSVASKAHKHHKSSDDHKQHHKSSNDRKPHKSSGDHTTTKKRWSVTLPMASVTASTSYQAFDHSAGRQPLTHSALALPTTAHQPQPQQNVKYNGLAAAAAAAATSAAASAAIHPSSSAYVAINHPSSSWTHDAHGHHRQASIESGSPPSTLESDMAAAGFSGMYSQYTPKKSAMKSQPQNPSSIHPQMRSSALAHAQPVPLVSQTTKTRTYSNSYPMPQPIHMSGSSLFSHHHIERHHRPHRSGATSHHRHGRTQHTSHTMTGPFSMPNLVQGPLASHQSSAYQTRPYNGSASFVIPKKHVRFAS